MKRAYMIELLDCQAVLKEEDIDESSAFAWLSNVFSFDISSLSEIFEHLGFIPLRTRDKFYAYNEADISNIKEIYAQITNTGMLNMKLVFENSSCEYTINGKFVIHWSNNE